MLLRLTAGLAADRDPAAPLLTLYDGPARVELSGTTVENWVCKTANLLVDGYARPQRVGLLLPLHWQLPCFALGAVAAGAVAVVASRTEHLAGCEVAFVAADRAEAAAVDAGVDDVLAVSGHPLGARLPGVPALCLDAAVEVPTYGDRFPGPYATTAAIELDGEPFEVPELGLGADDRVLTALAPSTPTGLGVLLATMRAGGSLVLLAEGDAGSVAEAERVTATAGVALPGVREL